MSDPHLDLLDDARQAEAVADRTRRRLLTEADDQDASFATSLRAAAEAGGVVLAETTVGRTVRGRIDAVGDQHVVVEDTTATSYVRVDQLTAVRGVTGSPAIRATAEVADAGTPRSLGEVLAELAHQRTAVDVHLVGGAVVRGEVWRAGTDVLTVRAPVTGDQSLVQLRLAALITVHRFSS